MPIGLQLCIDHGVAKIQCVETNSCQNVNQLICIAIIFKGKTSVVCVVLCSHVFI